MFTLRYVSIKRKLTLITMVTSVTVLLFSSAAFFLGEVRSFRFSSTERVISIADLLAFNSIGPLSFLDQKLAQENLAALRTAPRIISSVLYAPDGTVFASYQRADIKTKLVPPPIAEEGVRFSAKNLVLFRPIKYEGDFLGTLYVESDMADLHEQLMRQLAISAIILIVASLVAFVMGEKLQQVISTPILNLAEVIDQISRTGDYSTRVSTESRDEIGLLYHGFNAMLDQLNKREQERDQALANLEATNQLLRESEQMRIKAIVDTAAEGIITLNDQSKIESFNRAAEKIFGYTGDETIGQEISLLLPSRDDNNSNAKALSLLGTLQGTGAAWGGEMIGQRKDSSTFPMELAMSVVRVGDKDIYTLIVRDITDRKTMEAELLQARKLEAIGQLAAGIAHEINTPIQYVGNNVTFLKTEFSGVKDLLARYTELLQRSKDGSVVAEFVEETESLAQQVDVEYLSEEIPKAIEEALEGVERVANIVRSMKEFSHPGTAEKTPLDLNRAIDVTVTVARNEWRYVSDVVLELDPDLPMVLCYPGDLNQAILNLIVNAAHAIESVVEEGTTERGKITISTAVSGKIVEIRVSDTGCGISKEVQERMFDPFFTTKEVGKGTGQGLAIVRSVIMEKHKGTIGWESEVGKGTTFVLHIPIE